MVLRILKISSLIAILLTLSACGNLRMDLFGKKLLPGQEGGGDSGSSTSYPKITKVEADTVGASQLHTSSLPRFTTAQVVPIHVRFSGPVDVTGLPTLELETGSVKRQAQYVSGSGTTTLTFEYQVVAGDSALTLDYTGTTALSLNGGTIVPSLDVAGTPEEVASLLTLPPPGSEESLASTTPILIRTIPEVKRLSTPETDVYLDGTSLEIVVKYDQPVSVTGSPSILVRVGAGNRVATYVTQISPSELLFRYNVDVGDDDTDGIELPTALTMAGATIVNPANEAAVTDLPVKDTTGVKTYTSALTASFVSSTRMVGEDVGTILIPVVLSAPAPFDFKVTIQVLGEVAPEDYVLSSRELFFTAGSDRQYIELELLDDNLVESDERLRLILSKNSLGTGGTLSAHEILIRDNDSVAGPQVVKYRAGGGFACALYDNKDLRCFGANNNGQLGDGSLVDKPVPTGAPVMQNVEHFDVSHSLACASNTAGELWCWGNDNWGFLPGPATSVISTPRKLINADVGQVGLTARVFCYIKKNPAKDLICWGRDETGVFGLNAVGITRTVASPVTVDSGVEDFMMRSFAAGEALCSLKKDAGDSTKKDLYCWGLVPTSYSAGNIRQVPAVPLATDVVGFHAGGQNLCVTRMEGAPLAPRVYCMGENYNGQFTPGTSGGAKVTTLTAMSAEYQEIMPSGSSMCGIRSADGSVWCWGSGADIPGASTALSVVPRNLIPEGAVRFQPVSVLLGTTDHRCVLMQDSSVQCWALSVDSSSQKFPVTVMRSGVKDVSLSATVLNNYSHACAVMESGEVLCWGQNGSGQVGDRTTLARLLPTQALARNQDQIVVERERSCAISNYGELRCWGRHSSYGGLGLGGTTNTVHHTPKVVLAKGVRKVALNEDSGCAVVAEGELWCWGDNSDGQVKPGQAGSNKYVPVQTVPSGVRDVVLGAKFTCYITNDDDLFCWGDNAFRQLGTGDTTDSPTIPATPLLQNVDSVFLGGSLTSPASCALLKDGSLKCWGAGQNCLGTNANVPTDLVGISDVRQLAVGGSHICAVTGEERALKCWGTNMSGELGTGDTVNRCLSGGAFTVVPAGVKQVRVGLRSTCFVMASTGELKCMGDNDKGILGTGDKYPFPRTIWGL